MATEPELLFVYGTLRPRCASAETSPLVHGLPPAGSATIDGTLHDLGDYPGLVSGDGIVHGDLLWVSGEALRRLDLYEGCDEPDPLFRRDAAIVRRADGAEVVAWVYRYARPIGDAPIIHGGDYAARPSGT